MADNDGGSERNTAYSRSSSGQNDDEASEDGGDDTDDAVHPDIGLGAASLLRNHPSAECSSGAGSCSTEGPSKREEPTSLSFKHFLSNCSSIGGARPKIYSARTPPSTPSQRLLPNPEMTSGLPDFVQDHLVIEQCYLNSSTPPQLAVDLDNIIPDYNPLDTESDFSSPRSDLTFDLPRRGRCNELPLDLPDRMPFDLPRSREPQQSGEVGPSKSLPDFLSDGPIRSERRPDQLGPDHVGSSSQFSPDLHHSPDHRAQMENDRLRRELNALFTQLNDQIRRSETLEAELCIVRSREQSDVVALEKVIVQLEDDLKRATKRAVNAEGQVSKLKKNIQRLTCELNSLRNSKSRDVGAAASSSAVQTDNERLASQLRNAANTAELSLRHLLLGVDNLRELAKSLEPPLNPRYRLSSSDDSQDEMEPGPTL